jgi:16S rRNA (guanine966-N2)-methyltransferase
MKIISGDLGGRNFISTAKTTHPMSEKMRGSIFNSLGDVSGLRFLDAFSGSGALAFEAISRGASEAVAVESNKIAQKDIESNIKSLGLKEKVKLIKAPLSSWLQTSNDNDFDIIIVDPPYEKPQIPTVLLLEKLLSVSGVLIVSLPPNYKLPSFGQLKTVSKKDYGDSSLIFFKSP